MTKGKFYARSGGLWRDDWVVYRAVSRKTKAVAAVVPDKDLAKRIAVLLNKHGVQQKESR